jgi:PAS domain S-box-containing protein
VTSLRRYLVSVAVLLVLLICAAAAVLIVQVDRYGRDQSARQILATSRALSLVVDSELQRYEAMLHALAMSESLERNDWAAFDGHARRLLSGPGAWIILADRNGRQWVNTRLPPGSPLPVGRTPPEMWPVLDAGKTHFCNLARGEVERRIVCVDVPIMRNGRAAYHLSVVMRPDQLSWVTERQRLQSGSFGTLLDRKGMVIWRNVDAARYVGKPGTPDFLRRLKTQGEGVGESVSLNGVPTYIGFSRSPLSGWTFIVAVPRSQLAAGLNRALGYGGPAALLLLLVGGLAGLVAARRITRAVDGLSQAALRIADDKAPAFTPSGLREIDAVGRALESAIEARNLSEERLELAQQVGGIGAWDWDVVADRGHVSDAYKAMLGLAHVEGPLSLGQLRDVIHPDDLGAYLAQLEAARSHVGASVAEYRVIHGDGSTHWITAKGRPLLDAEGRYTRAVGIARETTAEHIAERVLRESEENLKRLNALLAERVEERTAERDRLWTLSPDPFVVAEAGGTWIAASPAWTDLLGWSVDELVGRDSGWLLHPDERAHVAELRKRIAAGEIVRDFTVRLRTRAGDYRCLSWTCIPEGGRIYAAARDVTEERERAEALRKAEDALRQSQKMESIGQITGGLAHDFNNLLSPILGTLDLLQQRGLPDARSERLVGGAIEAAERARMLVQRLLAFARRQPLQPSAVDVAELVENLRGLLGSTLGPGIRFAIAADPGIPPALVDANQLELAILNLAVNARDAMPDGGQFAISIALDSVTAEGGSLRVGDYVRLEIVDTGMGMPPSVLERAVEPFFSTKGTGRGTGLGLSMVHGLVAQLGGAMTIDSEVGNGTRIRLWLPVAPTGAEPAVAEAPAPRAAKHRGTAMLVDDEPLVRASTAQMLSELGYRVAEAGSAREALDRLDGGAGIDLLVTDHFMPETTGTGLARIVRRRIPDLPILIISGYADVDDIAPDLPRLAKPFRQAELALALAAITG